jgi:hypothetical protein
MRERHGTPNLKDNMMLRTADTAQWHALVGEASVAARCSLDEPCSDYLVLLLLRMFSDSNLSASFAKSQLSDAFDDMDLREVGDQCLVLAGLFPDRVSPHQVPISYFVDMGARAYREFSRRARNPFYQKLSEQFVTLVDVLQRMRELDTGHCCLGPLEAFELWRDTRSQHAWDIFTRCGQVLPSPATNSSLH